MFEGFIIILRFSENVTHAFIFLGCIVAAREK